MFVDASALVAIIAGEPDGMPLVRRLDAAELRHTSPVALYETTMALLRIRDTSVEAITALLNKFVQQSRLEIVSMTPEIGRIAVEAFARFGRGNHPARLNMGDCFAYACARSLGAPLLCNGDDFRQTDVEIG